MCGIAGFVDFSRTTPAHETGRIVQRMTDALLHRGPDDAGAWQDAKMGIALGHRRLSIVDLSPQGHQPMVSACGRYVVTFNGEIYNHKQLRGELERDGRYQGQWRGSSDTEVMLAAFSAWGVERALERFVGMFAVAVLDRETRVLKLIRDRAGEKPLYYGWSRGCFLFASELKALRAHPSWSGSIDRVAFTQYVRYGYVPGPLSIYEGVFKVPPGSMVTIACGQNVSPQDGRDPLPAKSYWAPSLTGTAASVPHDAAEAVGRLTELLCAAIRDQMVADVPVGAFLSGGIDSSTVVAVMQRLSTHPVRTFTIGFSEDSYNEARHAKAIAKHLGTNHTELYVTPAEARDVIPKLPGIYDEPFGDSSQIPTYLVAGLARRDVTVSLSGDGGDELFGGYPRYQLADKVWRTSRLLPRRMRNWGAQLLERTLQVPLVRSLVPSSERGLRLAGALQASSAGKFYEYFLCHARDPRLVALQAEEAPTDREETVTQGNGTDFPAYLMQLDLAGYLPDDILVKVDRAAMAHSLETRIPLLDHRIVSFARSLPAHYRIKGPQTKWILRQVLYQYLPQELVQRPKMGFGLPIATWLRGPLHDWAADLIGDARLAQEALFNTTFVRRMWKEFEMGGDQWQHSLWDILMFQSWLRAQRA